MLLCKKRDSRGQCLWELDPKRRNLLVQLASVGSVTPNLEAKAAGKCWFARRDLQADVHPLHPAQMLVVLGETIYPGCYFP